MLVNEGRDCQDGAMALRPRQVEILDLERTWWLEPGPKEATIRARLGLSATRYYRLLHELLDEPEALAYDPLVVRRLRRTREQRRRARFEGRAGAEQRHRSEPPRPSRR